MGRHFTQVIFPDVGLQGSAGKGFAGHGYDATLPIPPGIAGCGNDEADLGTLLPERPGKFVGKEERIVAPPLGEQLYRVVKADPGGLDPAARNSNRSRRPLVNRPRWR